MLNVVWSEVTWLQGNTYHWCVTPYGWLQGPKTVPCIFFFFFYFLTNAVGKCHEVCRRYQWHVTLSFPQKHLYLSWKMLFQTWWYKNMVSLPWAWDFCCWHGTYLTEVDVLSFCSCSCCHFSCESFKSAIEIYSCIVRMKVKGGRVSTWPCCSKSYSCFQWDQGLSQDMFSLPLLFSMAKISTRIFLPWIVVIDAKGSWKHEKDPIRAGTSTDIIHACYFSSW